MKYEGKYLTGMCSAISFTRWAKIALRNVSLIPKRHFLLFELHFVTYFFLALFSGAIFTEDQKDSSA